MSREARSTPAVSVVIPTHDRLDVLPEVLSALGQQEDAPPYEVVVVDDGSREDTVAFLKGLEPGYPWRFVRQENQGPAAARNRGVSEATGEIVAFLGDDTVPAPGWLACHYSAHGGSDRVGRREKLAVIGYTGWHARMRRNAFLDYINEHGLQFGYALIEDPERVPFNFFYTSNLSLPRALLVAEPFDTGFPYAAWEDIELSYRLTRAGMRLRYCPQARVAHDHPTDLARFARRQERAGYCAVVFYRLHPELGPFLGIGEGGPPALPAARRQRWLSRMARTLQGLSVAVSGWLPLSLPSLWEEVLRYHYIAGLRRGWAELVEAAEVGQEAAGA